MSYRVIVLEGYEVIEATNDVFGEDFFYSENNNVINLRDEANKRETLNAFQKILTKDIYFD